MANDRAAEGETTTASWERSRYSDDGKGLSLAARLLLRVGKGLVAAPEVAEESQPTFAKKYREFVEFFPSVDDCAGKRIIEIGGGVGEFSRYLADRGAEHVLCVEPNPTWFDMAKRACAGRANLEVISAFGQQLPLADSSSDLVILHDVMEHVDDPVAVLAEAKRVLRPGGQALVYFMPFYAPYGGHTWSFLPVPWAHIFYSRRVLAEMRAHISGWHTTELPATGLYKMSIADLEHNIAAAGLTTTRLHLVGLKKQAWLTKIPVVREACTTIVAAHLTKAG